MTKLESRKNEVWMIWPEDAKRILAMNYKGNRKIGTAVVMKYANDMKNGQWGDTPSPLVITKGGVLLDGQHRLSAVIEAGVPVVFEVRIVSDDNMFQYIDNGKSRVVTDYIKAGNRSVVASVALFAYCATYGTLPFMSCFNGKSGSYVFDKKGGSIRPTRAAVVKYTNDHIDGFERIASQAKRMYGALRTATQKECAVALWLISKFDSVDLTDEFVNEFCKPAPDSKAVAAGKTTLAKAFSGSVRPASDYVVGTLIEIYRNFVDCTGKTRFVGWKSVIAEYESKIDEMRKKKNESER